MQIEELLVHPGFLDCFRIEGLWLIARMLNPNHLDNVPREASMSKRGWIRSLTSQPHARFPNHLMNVSQNTLLDTFDNEVLLNLLGHRGFNFLDKCLGLDISGTIEMRARCMLNHFPIQTTITDACGPLSMKVRRIWTRGYLQEQLFNERFIIMNERHPVPDRLMQSNIRTGLQLHIIPRVPAPLADLQIQEDGEPFDDGIAIKVTFRYGNRDFHCKVGKFLTVKFLKMAVVSFDDIRNNLLAMGSNFNMNLLKLALFRDGNPLAESDTPLADYYNILRPVLHAYLIQPGGMPPKGSRRVDRDEKLHQVRAAAMYRVQNFTLQDGVQNLCNQAADQAFIQNRIQGMPLANLTTMKARMDEIQRNDRVSNGIIDSVIPELAQLKAQVVVLQDSITAIEHSFEVGFMTNFFQNRGGLDTEPLYALCDEVLNRAQDAQREADINERAHRLAAAQVSAASASTARPDNLEQAQIQAANMDTGN